MCGVIAALVFKFAPDDEINKILQFIWEKSHARGRDGRGIRVDSDCFLQPKETREITKRSTIYPFVPTQHFQEFVVIGNLRAEPTTEYIKEKQIYDQQPYTCGDWSIVHNGTIANDKELRTYELPTKIDSAAIAEILKGTEACFSSFSETVSKLKGSYAIIATNSKQKDTLYVATNYKPIWFISTDFGYFFASSKEYLPQNWAAEMVAPYSISTFTKNNITTGSTLPKKTGGRAVIICSGGLDSVVSATFAQRKLGYSIELLHFLYGSRAENKEIDAIKAIAAELKCEYKLFPLPIYRKEDSPLLDPNALVAGGEAGAEFASEWVPARNLVMLSIATAYAEARGITTIILGNNLEESGSYPDNEPEFINKFNELLPFAVGANKQVEVLMPVGNLMKHEIVKLGHDIGAPMYLTWSCYRAGKKHCGACGPCYMRRIAHEMNNIPETISYLDE